MLLPIFPRKKLALWMGTRKGTSAPAVNCCLIPTDEAEGQMLKTTKGGVAYWLLGGASVVLATWQFALIVAS
jgi:hypothetical protein